MFNQLNVCYFLYANPMYNMVLTKKTEREVEGKERMCSVLSTSKH